jgi:hypothetical protein
MIRFATLGVLAALPAAAHEVGGAPHAHPHLDPNLLLATLAGLAVVVALFHRAR